MPLLRISLLFLLLPLSLCCNRTLEDVRDNYLSFVKTDLENAVENVAALLQNSSSCPRLKQKLHNCTGNTDVVKTLHKLICKMRSVNSSHTGAVVAAVLNSLNCSCGSAQTPISPTGKPKVTVKRRRAAARRRRGEERRIMEETKKLCRVQAILAKVTQCYQILNFLNEPLDS